MTVYEVVEKLESIDSVLDYLDENRSIMACADAIRLLNEYRDMLLSLKVK